MEGKKEEVRLWVLSNRIRETMQNSIPHILLLVHVTPCAVKILNFKNLLNHHFSIAGILCRSWEHVWGANSYQQSTGAHLWDGPDERLER